jgi:hypothetical protein
MTLRTIDQGFVDELEHLGYFRLVAVGDAAEARQEILARRYPLAGDVGRLFMADAEQLADGGVGDLVGTVAPFLQREGVSIEVKRGPAGTITGLQLSLEPGGALVTFVETVDDDYRVTLGLVEVVVWTGDGGNKWHDATGQTVALLNRLLSSHGSFERAWSLHGGANEGFIVFATVEQVHLLNSALPERGKLSLGA